MSKSSITPPNSIQPSIPIGTILAFYGDTANISNGWVLCSREGIDSLPENKQSEVPNLEGLTLIGQGAQYPFNIQGGEVQHTLTIEEMPVHDHNSDNSNQSDNNGQNVFIIGHANSNTIKAKGIHELTEGLGGGGLWGLAGCTHCTDTTGNGHPHNNMQPYLPIYYIMFIGLPTEGGLYTTKD